MHLANLAGHRCRRHRLRSNPCRYRCYRNYQGFHLHLCLLALPEKLMDMHQKYRGYRHYHHLDHRHLHQDLCPYQVGLNCSPTDSCQTNPQCYHYHRRCQNYCQFRHHHCPPTRQDHSGKRPLSQKRGHRPCQNLQPQFLQAHWVQICFHSDPGQRHKRSDQAFDPAQLMSGWRLQL